MLKYVMKIDWNWMKRRHFTTGGVAQADCWAIRDATLETSPAPAWVDLATSSRWARQVQQWLGHL